MMTFLLLTVAALLEAAGGGAAKDTATFEVKRAGWQVEWEGRDVRIYVLNENNQVMFVPANEKGASKGKASVPLDAGRYYLRVSGAQWKVTVAE